MAIDCTRCDRPIGETDVRYTRRLPEAEPGHYCSLNCLADVGTFEEEAVRAALFEALPAE